MVRPVLAVASLTCLLAWGALGHAGGKKDIGFGTLEALAAKDAQIKARNWLLTATNGDAAKLQAFDRVWSQSERAVLERLADTFALGSADAQKLLAEARDVNAPAPTEVPAFFKDAKQDSFLRANLALAYSRALSNRRVHEEALDTLVLVRPEHTVDPATYLFHRAVCEHSMLRKKEAIATINRLVQDAVDAPERYKIVGMLMLLDMQTWKDKDLAAIARKMSNVERRLELARGGEETQRQQREIVARLDELIKELENKKKPPGDGPPKDGPPSDGPPGGQPKPGPGSNPKGGPDPSNPLPDSATPQNGGTGAVELVKGLRKYEEGWGKMSPSERAAAMVQIDDLTRHLSPAHQEAYRNYFRNLAAPPSKQ
jgi:hypothetical protein